MLHTRYIQHEMGDISLGKLHKTFLQKKEKGSLIKDQKLTDYIEVKVPGSKYILNHVLWTILEESDADLKRVYELMRSLPPEIQTILF